MIGRDSSGHSPAALNRWSPYAGRRGPGARRTGSRAGPRGRPEGPPCLGSQGVASPARGPGPAWSRWRTSTRPTSSPCA